MRKLKLAAILPALQFIIAVSLLKWHNRLAFPPRGDELHVSTERMICLGINGPAWLFSILLSPLPISRVGIFGLYDIQFLIGVAALWYVVGKSLDRRSSGASVERASPGYFLWNLFLVSLGVYFFSMALASLRSLGRYNNPVGNLIEGILFFVWSVALITFPGIKLVNALRRKQVKPQPSAM